jgi:PII-like signaling protein
MRTTARATRLTIHCAQPYRHREEIHEFIKQVSTLGISGASVFPGICGFGRGHHLHEIEHGRHADETPITIIVIDDGESINDVLRAMHTLLPHAIGMTDDVVTIRYDRQPASAQHSVGLRAKLSLLKKRTHFYR